MKTIQITLCMNYYTLAAFFALCITAVICAKIQKKKEATEKNEEF